MKLLAILTAFIFCTAQAQKHYPLKNFLRANIHPWDMVASDGDYSNPDIETNAKQKAIIAAGLTGLRIYNDVPECKSDDNATYRFSPQGNGFRTDSALQMLKAANPSIHILFCWQNAPKNIQAEYTNAGERNTAYVHRGADRLNPASYSELAHDCYVLAARGGSNPNVRDYPVWASPNWWEAIQPMLKGANLYDEIELQNELDNNWSNTNYFDGYQYAAMWKPCRDSIKKADPNLIVCGTGVMDGGPTILKEAIEATGGNLPIDKYQFHCYPSGLWHYSIAAALPPEQSMSIEAGETVRLAQSVNIPAVIGEWGYDLNPHSPLGIIAFGGHSGEQLRAWWSARAILEFARMGVESAYYYRLYQDYGATADSSENLFASTSLFIQDDQNLTYKRRLVGDMFKQFTAIGDFVFDSAVTDSDSVKVYIFKKGAQRMYVGWTVEKVTKVQLWGATRPEFTERVYSTKFPAGTRYDINEDSSGKFASQPFYGGDIVLSSKPVIVVTEQALPIYDEPLPTRPFPDEKFNVEVFNYAGQLLMKRKNVTVKEMEAELPRNRYFILKYWNANKFFTDKIFKR